MMKLFNVEEPPRRAYTGPLHAPVSTYGRLGQIAAAVQQGERRSIIMAFSVHSFLALFSQHGCKTNGTKTCFTRLITGPVMASNRLSMMNQDSSQGTYREVGDAPRPGPAVFGMIWGVGKRLIIGGMNSISLRAVRSTEPRSRVRPAMCVVCHVIGDNRESKGSSRDGAVVRGDKKSLNFRTSLAFRLQGEGERGRVGDGTKQIRQQQQQRQREGREKSRNSSSGLRANYLLQNTSACNLS